MFVFVFALCVLCVFLRLFVCKLFVYFILFIFFTKVRLNLLPADSYIFGIKMRLCYNFGTNLLHLCDSSKTFSIAYGILLLSNFFFILHWTVLIY